MLPVVEVVATPVEQAASLEIVAAFAHEPLGARAIVRDGEGRVIVGAPVTWSLVEGELALATVNEFTPPEYTMIGDDCVPPPTAPESRRAVLRAQLGELSDELEIEWTAKPPRKAVTSRSRRTRPASAARAGRTTTASATAAATARPGRRTDARAGRGWRR
ncbi:hypothetical protein [Nannocystis pusilla]|uniref:hypothetical protein n=1 Tax=Nannocystis pusilla TaxID=889268 RepID=UPI003B81CBA6